MWSASSRPPRARAVPAVVPPLPVGEPAVVLSASLDIVASNARWDALHTPFQRERNVARAVFLHPEAPVFFVDRRHEQHDVVAMLNDAVDDPVRGREAARLCREMAAVSLDFRRLFEGRRLRPLRVDTYAIRHPELGPSTFRRRTRLHGAFLRRVVTPCGDGARLLSLLDSL